MATELARIAELSAQNPTMVFTSIAHDYIDYSGAWRRCDDDYIDASGAWRRWNDEYKDETGSWRRPGDAYVDHSGQWRN